MLGHVEIWKEIHLNTRHFWGFGYQFVKFQGRNPTNQTVAPENRGLVLPEKERPGPFSKHQFSSGFSAVGFREGKFLKNTIPETNIGAENWWLEDEFLFGMAQFLGAIIGSRVSEECWTNVGECIFFSFKLALIEDMLSFHVFPRPAWGEELPFGNWAPMKTEMHNLSLRNKWEIGWGQSPVVCQCPVIRMVQLCCIPLCSFFKWVCGIVLNEKNTICFEPLRTAQHESDWTLSQSHWSSYAEVSHDFAPRNSEIS